ncbi:hypothetical protein [Shewanella salipaludis]|uniref:Lipoprotein n=1 Tax=Shewanella salipaludis TaxID=2723052 RepID=A0A972FUB4_9GAMM|nr:hypothetical protein [Shewanella salipaludis]NMH65802.1 hypothetical protein [Shewanella salipaludis]
MSWRCAGGILLAAGLTGCASAPDPDQACGTVSAYLQPDSRTDWYRVVVTHLDGKAVISRPNYALSPGVHEFTLAELIDDPALKVALAARVPKNLSVTVAADERYHLGAKFNQDRPYQGNDPGYWQPGIWQQEAHECRLSGSQR